MESQKQVLSAHLDELRNRIIKSIISIAVCSLILYNCVDSVILLLIKPVGKLVFIAPQEAFVAKIKIAFFMGFLFSSPFVILQIWKFISSGLNKGERRHIGIFAPLSLMFFFLGALFGYLIIIPIGMRFLLGFASEYVIPMITISSYISFVITLTLTFGLIFELPIAVLFLTKIGIVSPHFLIQKRKEAVVLVFIIAAFLTPPDIITQALMALPLIILYEISIVFSKFAYRSKTLHNIGKSDTGY